MSLEPAFALLLALTILSRLAELAVSRRNLAALRALAARSGGVVKTCEPASAFAAMIAIHLLLLVAPAAENALLERRTPAPLFAVAALLWSCGQALRWASVRALGIAWNVRGAVASVQPVIRGGLYGRVRHPNYLGVLLEGVAIPLAGSAWISLLPLNVLLIPITLRRLRAEERLLAELPPWRDHFAGKGLFPPRIP